MFKCIKNVVKAGLDSVREAVEAKSVKGFIGALAVAFALVLGNSSAMAQVTLPDTGCDVSGYVTATITALGAIIAVVLGGYAAFLLIRKAMRWMGRALG